MAAVGDSMRSMKFRGLEIQVDDPETRAAGRRSVTDMSVSPRTDLDTIESARRRGRGVPPLGQSPTAEDRAVAKTNILDHLMYVHLKCMGLTESAEAFLAEGLADSDNPELEKVLAAATGSPLQTLFGHRRSTDRVIDELLSETPSKLIASAHHFFDRDTMHHLVQMAMTPMWSTPVKVHMKSGDPGNISRAGSIIAATLNQLVERITKVIHQPYVTEQRAHQEMDAQFVQGFLRTYKHFAAPQTLLAKMFQRWFVPMGLPFTDVYSNYYIMINSKQGKSSAQYWETVTAKIRYKVSGVILDWLREFPEDWDDLMLKSLETFLDDNYYRPSPATPQVTTQLLQYSEGIKQAMNKIVLSRQRQSAAAVSAAMDTMEGEGPEVGNPMTFLCEELTDQVLAKQLTAVDHEYLRDINVRELLDFSKNEMHFCNLHHATGAGGGPLPIHAQLTQGGSNIIHPTVQSLTLSPRAATHLRTSGTPRGQTVNRTETIGTNPYDMTRWAKGLSGFISRSQDVQHWVIVELLTTPTHSVRVEKLQKFVSIAYRLLEMNNFFTCQSLVFAFNHPALQRLSALLDTCRERIDHLSKVFCSPASNAQIKELLSTIRPEDQDRHPPIPCLGVWVSDLQLLEESEPTVLLDSGVGLIHWRKYQAVGTIFTRFATIQNYVVPPTYYRNENYQQFIATSLARCRQFLARCAQENRTLLDLSLVVTGGGDVIETRR
eukprot:TRINITY_DN12771_c0_g1_i1.p1 TRINITY_DN12771_c0_g1~~TRINITY_DN12771_c0_g1_i1.p1  ORF type:complete len:718 (+),score=270.58 TRINITY_DN12771_c0_g1_i1:72-2225(+)